MNDYEYGPKYPPGEIIFVEEVGWAKIVTVTWQDERWNYAVTRTDNDEEFEVEEWQILV